MSDIVERLRDYGRNDTDALMDEAADEIERLRRALVWLRAHPDAPYSASLRVIDEALAGVTGRRTQ